MKTISTISILLFGTFISFGQVAETIKSASGKEALVIKPDNTIDVKGAGITTRTAGKDGFSNSYTAVLGQYSTDKFQEHHHAPNKQLEYYEGGRTYNLQPAGGVGLVIGETSEDLIGDSRAKSGSTLRVGNLTEPQNLGINFIIKY